MAPLKRNGRNGMFTPIPGIGFDVTLAEIMHNLAVYRGGVAIQLGLARGAFTEESRRRQWRNAGVDEYVELFFGEADDSVAHKQHLVKRGMRAAEARCAAGQEVLFAIYTDLALSEGVMALLEGMTTEHGERAITLLFLGPETIGAEPPPLADLDAAFTFTRFRARQGWWPAVDPIRSYSAAFADETHAALARRARRLCRRYADLDLIYQKEGMDGFHHDFFSAADRRDVGRARRLHHYLTQPLMIVEPWTMQPGTAVPLSKTLATINDLLEGKMDDVPEEDLAYLGSWDPRWT